MLKAMNNDSENDILSKVRAKILTDTHLEIEGNKNLIEAVNRISTIFDIFHEDANGLFELTRHDKSSQVWRRSFYRVVFSSIEGIVYQMKQVALCTQNSSHNIHFSSAEIQFLQDKDHFLNGAGKATTQSEKYPSFLANFRFAFSMLIKGFSIARGLNVGVDEWRVFQESVKVRNRLTHPKEINNLTVTDEDIRTLTIAMSWFNSEITHLVTGMLASTKNLDEHIRVKIEEKIKDSIIVFSNEARIRQAITIIDELASDDVEIDERRKKAKVAKTLLNEHLATNLSKTPPSPPSLTPTTSPQPSGGVLLIPTMPR